MIGSSGQVKHIRLRQSDKELALDTPVREQLLHPAQRQRPRRLDVVRPPARETLSPVLYDLFRHPFRVQEIERQPGVGLDGEPLGGGLHPVALPQALDLARELSLLGRIADVHDDAVAEDDVEGLVGELNGVAGNLGP